MRAFLWLATAALAVAAAASSSAQNTVPLSVYTLDQADKGGDVYRLHCASCHGDLLEGVTGPGLKGHAFRQLTASQGMTAYTLLTVISLNEPENRPGSLTQEEYGDVVAFILQQNGYPAGRDRLSAGSLNLKQLDLTQ
jgi:mono/diheme cytochrome c family protein